MKKLSEMILLAVFILMLISVSELKAQIAMSPGQAVQDASDRSLETRMRSNELERIKREAERDLVASKQEPVRRFPEIKEDFEKIQVVNLDSVQKIVIKPQPDYRAINKAAVEIRKRANRLKNNLFPTPSSESDKSANKDSNKNVFPNLSTANLKPLSVALDNAIYRFISNSMFQNINVVNINDSNKAQNELNNIIKICSLIEDKTRNNSN